jgi:hypothetical protein
MWRVKRMTELSARSRGWLAACLVAAATTATAAPQRIVDWRADGHADKPAGWVLERYGNVREASLRMNRDAGGAVAQARFASGDTNRPTASLRFPVPFQALHTYRITLEISAPEGADADVMVRRRPAPYDPMAVRSVSLSGNWQTVELEATWPADAPEGDVRVQLSQREGSVAVRRLTVDDQGPAPLGVLPVAAFPPTLIGVHVNKLGQHNTWPAAGQSLVRLWDTYTTWSALAPSLEEFDGFRSQGWRRLDLYVDYVRRNRPDATILYTLGMPPAWASASPDAQCPYGKGTCGAPASIAQWRHYVRTVAERYKGRIRHWELWNEADYRMFFLPTMPMADLAKAAREELSAVDPQNKLISPGYTSAAGLNALFAFLQSGGGRYVDIIGFHWYFDSRPERLAAPIQNVRRLLRASGAGDKPIWNTEGAPLCRKHERGDCQMDGDLSAAEQDAVAARAILTMWLNGVEAFAYYTVEGAGGRTLALLTDDFKSSTRAAAQLKRFSAWMVGARALGVKAWGSTGHAVELERGGERFMVAWAEAPNERLPAAQLGAFSKQEVLGEDPEPLAKGADLSVGRVPVRLSNAR